MPKFTGERRAIAAAALAFYAFVYVIFGMLVPPEWSRAFTALGFVYGLGFFAIVAGYFWARWYAVGVALSGVISTAVSIWQMGPEPVLLFVGGTHALIALALLGKGMAELFDGRDAWRARFHMDEHAANRLGNAVIRLGVSLPFVLLYALAPKDGAATAALGVAALTLTAVSLAGLVRLKTWGVLALGGGTVALGGAVVSGMGACGRTCPAVAASTSGQLTTISNLLAVVAVALLAVAAASFLPALGRALRGAR
jgi:hypothetical protein